MYGFDTQVALFLVSSTAGAAGVAWLDTGATCDSKYGFFIDIGDGMVISTGIIPDGAAKGLTPYGRLTMWL